MRGKFFSFQAELNVSVENGLWSGHLHQHLPSSSFAGV